MTYNPIHSIVHGEAIIDGDASEGIDVKLYAVTPGWGAIAADSGMLATGNGTNVIVLGGSPFVTSMIGRTITFVESGPATIVNVISATEIEVDGDFTLMDNEAFTIEAQAKLREVELDEDDELRVTNVFVSQEKDSEYSVVVDEDSPGRRLAKGRLLETGSINRSFNTPIVVWGTLKYFGHDNGLNVCLITGYIT